MWISSSKNYMCTHKHLTLQWSCVHTHGVAKGTWSCHTFSFYCGSWQLKHQVLMLEGVHLWNHICNRFWEIFLVFCCWGSASSIWAVLVVASSSSDCSDLLLPWAQAHHQQVPQAWLLSVQKLYTRSTHTTLKCMCTHRPTENLLCVYTHNSLRKKEAHKDRHNTHRSINAGASKHADPEV